MRYVEVMDCAHNAEEAVEIRTGHASDAQSPQVYAHVWVHLIAYTLVGWASGLCWH